MKNQWSRRIFLKTKKMLWVRVKNARKTSFSAPSKGPRFSRTRALNASDTRVTADKAQRSMKKKRGEISPVFSFPPNLVPRVPSYPSLGARRGQVGDNPGNEVASPFLLRANFHLFLSPEPPVPWAGEAWGSLNTRAWGPPRPRAQTSPAKRTGGSGHENDFHRERERRLGTGQLLSPAGSSSAWLNNRDFKILKRRGR